MRQLIEFTVNKIDRYVLLYLVAIVSVISACIGLRGLLVVNQGEFFSSHWFMHYSNKSYETEWSFLNHKRETKTSFEGYMYLCDRKTGNKTYWKCESGVCRGRLITTHNDSEVEARPTKEHNHVPDTAKIEVVSLHLWNHDFYAQESNIISIFSIFFSIFFLYYFDVFRCFFSIFFFY